MHSFRVNAEQGKLTKSTSQNFTKHTNITLKVHGNSIELIIGYVSLLWFGSPNRVSDSTAKTVS
jgi:hypothetical protein